MVKKSIFRTLVRAENILNDQVLIVVPACDHRISFRVPMSIFPDDLKAWLFKGPMPYRFHAKANLVANEPQELELHDFELD